MKIDKNKLVELLVEKTSMKKHEVEAQLEQLIERIISATKRGKALEIKGFGTFYFDSDNELKFDASKSLSTEISYKYAGMQPVELVPERDTSIPVPDAETEIQDPMDVPPVVVTSVPADEKTEDKPEEYASIVESAGTDTEEQEAGDLPPLTPAKETVSADIRQTGSDRKLPGTVTVPDPKQRAARAPITIGSRRKSGAIVWVFLFILLVAVALAAYFYFVGQETEASLLPPEATELSAAGQQVNGNETADTDSEASLGDMEITAEEEISASATPVTVQDNTEQEQVQNGAAAADLPNPSLYGLMGEVNPQANDGYSIVLHSFDEEAKTVEVVVHLKNEGYRTIVGSRTVGGRTMWRVSVGQFQTLQEAQDVAADLPPSFNTQNFIHRIQLNN